MKKRMFAMLLALCMLLSLLPATVLAAEFSDTQGHWSEAAVDRWAANGVVHGDEGNFFPDKEMTRAEMAALLANLLGLTDKGTASFADVADDAWYADAILKCAAAGIMLGDGVNANPDGKLTREEAACLVGRALGIQPVAGEASFSDGSKVSDWASGYVNAMSQKGIISGMGDNTFAPAANINRASVVSILNESISTYCNTPGEKVEATGEGITLVAAPDVTVSGKVEDLVVSAGAQGSDVTVENTTVSGTLTVTAPETTVTLKTDTTVASAVLTETAEQSKIVVEKTAEVGTLTAAAPDSTVTVSGKVENVTVADSASNTTVEAAEGSTITKVDNAAEGTTVTGSGKVENVTTSGDNTTVDTKGTTVDVAEGTTGTTAGGKEVGAGESTSTSGTPNSPSVPVHYCSYTYTDNGDGTHTGTCSCGATTSAAIHVVGDDGKCSVCGASSFVARIGTVGYTSLQDALNAGGEVVLLKDINTPTTTYTVTKDVTLNLNDKTLSGSGYDGTLCVNAACTLTINGDGNVIGNDDQEYGMAVWGAADGAMVIINGGNYSNTLTHKDTQMDMIYMSNGADAIINGGTFKCSTPKWTLNIRDDNYKDETSTIVVKGGSFYQYDPSNANNENPKADFVSTGHKVFSNNDWYTVVPGDGTSDKPYEISTSEQLSAALNATYNSDTTIKLLNDITLSGDWGAHVLKGTNNNTTVTIDGNGKTIWGLTSSGNNAANGFNSNGLVTAIQSSLSGVTFKNLTVSGATLTNDGGAAAASGVFVGDINTVKVTFDTCTVTGANVTSNAYAAGFVGYVQDVYASNPNLNCPTTLKNCTVTNSSFSGGDATGAMIGLNNGATTINGATVTGNNINGGAGYSAAALVGTTAGNVTATSVSLSNNTYTGGATSPSVDKGDYGKIACIGNCSSYSVNGTELKA